MTKKFWYWLGGIAVATTLIACGSGGGKDVGAVDNGPAATTKTEAGEDKAPSGVYKFAQTVKFKDGSTLTVGKPVAFKRSEYAAGGEGAKYLYKFKATFVNKTDKVFDPALTSGAASANGEEGESVYQEGLDAPDNKVLPGKSITWWMGYGLASNKDLQLEVSMGFLDYNTVIFTN